MSSEDTQSQDPGSLNSASAEAAATSFSAAASRSQPERDLRATKFRKHHLAISRAEYDNHGARQRQRKLLRKPTELDLVIQVDPTAEHFLSELQKVGHLYGWDKRRKYQLENKASIEAMMAKPTTTLYYFKKGDERIGFCLVTDIDDDQVENEDGITKSKAVADFIKGKTMPVNATAREIYKIGLYDEHTGNGYGNFFLAKILRELFVKQNIDVVYLDTRDTNHARVIEFYEKNSVFKFYTEALENDLVEEAPVMPEPREMGLEQKVNGDDNFDDDPPSEDEIDLSEDLTKVDDKRKHSDTGEQSGSSIGEESSSDIQPTIQ